MSTKLYLRFPQTNRYYEVSPEKEVIVGRTPTCDVDLTHYLEGYLKAISRQHFKIAYSRGEGYYIVDISHNGTWINNSLLSRGERRILRDEDIVKLAGAENLIIEIAIDSDPDITDTIADPALFTQFSDKATGSGLYFDDDRSQFVVDDRPVPHEHLTKLETLLLRFLYDNAGRLCTFDAIAANVWHDPGWSPGNNTISRAVGNLRKKLDEVTPGAGDHIQNIRGQGYRLTLDISD